ncbi:MAG: dipeptidyl aminopeptidase/acylaminoacyl peptidase, partial [Glaciecola sp.]
MKNKILGLAILTIFFSCKEETIINQRKVKEYSIEQFMDNESVGGGSFSSDNNNLLVSSNRSGILNLYTVPSTGGKLTAITASDSTSIFAESYFPNDNRMLFMTDGNGDEIDHLFVRELDGTIRDITPFKGAKSVFYRWSKDEKHLYYRSNKRSPQYFDMYKLSIDDYTAELIYQNNDGLNFSEISNDENFFALSKTLNTSDADLFLYNVKTKQLTKINDKISANSAQGFSADNFKLYYTTDEGAEFSYLTSYDLISKEKNKIIERSWDVNGITLTSQGKYMAVYTNEDGKNAIEVLNTKTMKSIELPDFNNKSISNVAFSKDEKWMSAYVGGSNSPSDLYTYNLESKEQHKITSVLNDEIDINDLVTAKVVRFNSFDSTEIPAIYYLPHQASPDKKVPALIWVHGGPGGQSRQEFNSLIQYVVNHGYAILAVNNRGSSGYGKTFYKMDDKNHGEKDLQDCIEGKNWLAKQTEIQAEKIGIMGFSYGGYMTMAALTFAPEEFKVGVNIFGVTNWLRTLKSIPPYWESYREALYLELGNPFSADSIRLKQISP